MDKDNKPAWLRRVQEQSWEPEILISGIVLFTLFQLPEMIREFNSYLNNNSIAFFADGNLNDTISSALILAVYWLISGFSLHLFLRSVWTAFIGLSYIYPQGINREQLAYQSRFEQILSDEKSFEERILQLERLCSVLFSISFLLFMCVVGTVCYLMLIGIFIYFVINIYPPITQFVLFDLFLIIPGLVYMIDFILLGALKRIPVFSRVYYPVYVVMSVLTLSPFYRGIYYGLVSNNNRWRVILGLILFVIASVIATFYIREDHDILESYELSTLRDDRYRLFYGHYADQYAEHPSARIHIPSDIIDTEVLRVFVVHNSTNDMRAALLCDFDSLSAKGLLAYHLHQGFLRTGPG